jgi:DnaJ family protein A protein 2
MSDYYNILGVSKNATESEIQRAYKKAALKNHPDKGGDTEVFKNINEAKEVLTDSNKRKIYDTYGLDGLNQMNNRSQSNTNIAKGEDMVHQIKVTLDDLYNGKTMKFNITRNIICNECEGNGCKSGCSKICELCKGNKYNLQTVQFGPGMIQQMQVPCNKCNATGNSFNSIDKCVKCVGSRVIKEKKGMELIIEKGMQNNQQIIFPGCSNEFPGTISGDLVFVLIEMKHEEFTHEGNDLIMKQSIELVDALCGFSFYVKHLDAKIFTVSTRPGEIISPNSLKCVQGKGMPIINSNQFGDLKIVFDINFPKECYFKEEDINKLKEILPVTRLDYKLYGNNENKYYLSNYQQKNNNQPFASNRFKATGGIHEQQCAQQ